MISLLELPFDTKTVRGYLCEIYEDLTTRCQRPSNNLGFSAFQKYLGLPKIISQKIFEMLDIHKNGNLSMDAFSKGLYDMYAGDFNQKLEFAFSLLDFSKTGIIHKDDARLILSHLNMIEGKMSSQMIDEILNDVFLTESSISQDVFSSRSDLFFFFYFFIVKYTTIEPDNLAYYRNLNSNLWLEDSLKENENEIKYKKSKFFQCETKQNICKQNIHATSYCDDKLPQKCSLSSICTIVENSLQNSQPAIPLAEIKGLSMYKNKLRTMKLVLLNKDVFCFKLAPDKKQFQFYKIISLRSSLVRECENVKHEGTLYHSFQIRESLNANLSNIFNFLCEDITAMQKFTQKLIEATNTRIILDEYEIKETLGKGQFAKVKLGIKKATGEKVAIKIIKKKNIGEESLDMIEWEIDIFKFLKKTDHPGIIKSIDFFEGSRSLYFVYEYACNDTLTMYLYKKNDYLSQSELKSLAFQIGDAIAFLHGYGIVHRDIKPDNILVEQSHEGSVRVKLIDFGFSKVIGSKETITESYGTLCYVSPEVLSRSPQNHKVDVWSFGVLLYYLRFAILPFDSKNLKEICKAILKGSYTYPMNNNNNMIPGNEADLKEVICKCLQISIERRLTMREILKCKWFKPE